MSKKGGLIVALLVWVGYPLLSILTVLLALSRDPGFPGLLWGQVTVEAAEAATNSYGLTDFEMTNGIGPFKEELQIGEINEDLAQKGAQLFRMKCSGCHKLDQRYVGPPLRGVTSFRTPTYIMNMILNPQGMVAKHPVARGLLAQYYTVMSPQGVDKEKARAILEFLRSDAEHNLK